MPSLNAPMYRLHSSSLAIFPTVLNPPSGSLKNAVQVAEVRVIREATNVWPLVLLHALRCGGVAGAKSQSVVPCKMTNAYKTCDIRAS